MIDPAERADMEQRAAEGYERRNDRCVKLVRRGLPLAVEPPKSTRETTEATERRIVAGLVEWADVDAEICHQMLPQSLRATMGAAEVQLATPDEPSPQGDNAKIETIKLATTQANEDPDKSGRYY